MGTLRKDWRAASIFIVLALLAIGASGMVGYALTWIPEGRFLPEIALTMLLIAGLIALLAALSVMAAIFAALNLSDTAQSLSLPQGSVRAVIALSLILVFTTTAVFLYMQLREVPSRKYIGITQEQLDAIPAETIISIRPSKVGENLFDVERELKQSEASEDFAKQILTTISTLVVAIAGFYFGTRAVVAARSAVERPALRVLSPPSPVELGKEQGEKLGRIRLETTPRGEAITWEVEGDEEGTLVQVKPYEFEYTRGSSPEDIVLLRFALARHPEVSTELKVKAPAG